MAELFFEADGKCLIKNELLLNCASSYGSDSAWEGYWSVDNGELALDLELAAPAGVKSDRLKLTANVNIVNKDTINLYWTQKSVKAAEKAAIKLIKKRFTPQQRTESDIYISLKYGIDDFIYRQFFNSYISEGGNRYREEFEKEETSKISPPVFVRKK